MSHRPSDVRRPTLLLPSSATTAVIDPAGRIIVLSGTGTAATFSVFSPSLESLGTVSAGAGAGEAVLGPVVLADGRVAWTVANTVRALDPATPADGSVDLGLGSVASAPVVLGDGSLVMVSPTGELVEGPPDASPSVSAAILPASARFDLASSPSGEWLYAVAEDGTLHVIDRPKAQLVLSQTGATAGAPAPVSAEAVVVARSDGNLGGAVRVTGQWVALPALNLGISAPTAPVVGAGGLVLVASTTEKGLVGVTISGQTAVLRWTLEDLPEPASASPLFLSNGGVAVPLNSGELYGLWPPSPSVKPALAWRYSASGDLLVHPREPVAGLVLYLTGSGAAAVVSRPVGDLAHPWPSRGGGPGASGRAEQ